jgi:ATP-binding cassette subfamily G (WHITE) protein 2 (SNQ2)
MVRSDTIFIIQRSDSPLSTSAQIFQAIIMGAVFLQLPDETSGFFSRGGVLFL